MKRIIWTLLTLLCVAGAVNGQTGSNPLDPKPPKSRVLIGPVIGGTRNYHTGGFRTINDPICPIFESGTGWGILAGLSAEFQIGETWSLIPRICFDQRPGKFTQDLPDAKVLVPPLTEPITQTISAISTVTYQMLTAEVMYKQEFAKIGKVRLALAAGPVMGLVLGGKNRQVHNLIEPQNARFINLNNLPTENNGRTLVFFDADIPSRNSSRFSLKGGLQVEFGLFNNAIIATPGIYYDYGLTQVSGTENWNLSSMLFHIDFRRAF